MKKFKGMFVLPEESGIVLTSRELVENYTATYHYSQGIDWFLVLRAEIERDVLELHSEDLR